MQYYLWKDGRMHNGLVVVNYMLAEQSLTDGGFVCVPGQPVTVYLWFVFVLSGWTFVVSMAMIPA